MLYSSQIESICKQDTFSEYGSVVPEIVSWVPEQCDLILLDCTSGKLSESQVLNPFLVLSPRVFNASTSRVVGLPLFNRKNLSFSHSKNDRIKIDDNSECLMQYTLGQRPKTFNWRIRGAVPYPTKCIPDTFYARVCLVLRNIL